MKFSMRPACYRQAVQAPRWPRSLALTVGILLAGTVAVAPAVEPMNIGFLWHMHQPTYYPGETVTQTDAAGHFSYSVEDVHNQRAGPYTSWPKDAIEAGLGLSHLGAQVSFSGSLIENLDDLGWNNWQSSYHQAAAWNSSEGNPRLDLVNFGFNHPLMPLLDQRDIRMQIKLQKEIHQQTWGTSVPFSKGIFPPETAFSERIIPALVAEGIEWSIVDNIHFDRATVNYPHTNSTNLYAPNRADQVNPDPAAQGGAWVQLHDLWAPGEVSAPFSYQPHHVQYVDPNTGAISKLVAVPGARYEGNEDGRGGFGALQYETVMSQYQQYNTDPNHPMFVVLHHDGDNFGGGSDSYYHGNFQNMVSWAAGNPDYDVTTIQDYLDRFPVEAGDLIHVESGSWAGADNGDPEFKKWLGDPDASGWSPDRNSWAVLTAAKNRVFTADDMAPVNSMQNVLRGTGSPTERAWKYLLMAESSDYWYWDGTEVWDSNVTRASNLAVAEADQVIGSHGGTEITPPTVFLPQRESYNPGGVEWGPGVEPGDFEVWTYAYDVSELQQVTLNYRVDGDGVNPLTSTENETYAGGQEVGAWNTISMTSSDMAPPANILSPTYRAQRYGAMVTGQENSLLDYYVEAVDANGNVAKSDIQHVYVGQSEQAGGSRVAIGPDPAVAGEPVTITYDPTGDVLAGAAEVYLHLGFDEWDTVVSPDARMNWDPAAGYWDATVPVSSGATQLDLVFHDGVGNWDNNNGQDWHFQVTGTEPPAFVLDGVLDAVANEVAASGGMHLYVALEGETLYVATEDAGQGNDHFIYLALQPGDLTGANWAKAGQIAQWDAFLADENDNDYAAWNDVTGSTGAATGAEGGVLEGIINLAEEFGVLPSEIYIAVGVYPTEDGGTLQTVLQVPGSINNDGNLDALEYLRVPLAAVATGDFNGDDDADGSDFLAWQRGFGKTSSAARSEGDGNADGSVDADDLVLWTDQFGQAVSALAPTTAVPEPGTWWLAILGLLSCRHGRRVGTG